MTDKEYETVCEWLRVKYLPVDDPSADDILRIDHHLSLSLAEQAAVRGTPDADIKFWIGIEISRALYVARVDRERGVTEAKVAPYPERYCWS